MYLYNSISGCRHVVEESCLGVTEAYYIHMHVTFDLSLAVRGHRGHARLFGYSLSITELIIANSHFPDAVV